MDLDDFHAIYAAADSKWQAFLVCSLNFALHPLECAQIRKSDISREKREFQTNRTKTGELSCAMLWDEPVKRLDEYMASAEYATNQTEWLFATRNNTQHTTPRINEKMGRLRKRAGLAASGSFDPLRDLFATESDDTDYIAKMITMGHSLGELTKYHKRTPKKTASLHRKLEALVFSEV